MNVYIVQSAITGVQAVFTNVAEATSYAKSLQAVGSAVLLSVLEVPVYETVKDMLDASPAQPEEET